MIEDSYMQMLIICLKVISGHRMEHVRTNRTCPLLIVVEGIISFSLFMLHIQKIYFPVIVFATTAALNRMPTVIAVLDNAYVTQASMVNLAKIISATVPNVVIMVAVLQLFLVVSCQ